MYFSQSPHLHSRESHLPNSKQTNSRSLGRLGLFRIVAISCRCRCRRRCCCRAIGGDCGRRHLAFRGEHGDRRCCSGTGRGGNGRPRRKRRERKGRRTAGRGRRRCKPRSAAKSKRRRSGRGRGGRGGRGSKRLRRSAESDRGRRSARLDRLDRLAIVIGRFQLRLEVADAFVRVHQHFDALANLSADGIDVCNASVRGAKRGQGSLRRKVQAKMRQRWD
jgi:hypothetical protein